MAERKYFVLGGEYADTSFTTLLPGRQEERYGPFTEKEAYDHWRGLTAKTVDNALIRYRVRAAESPAEQGWWVVGGEYADATFTRLNPDQQLQKLGPFARPEAMAVWRSMSTRYVDNALVRFQIVAGDGLAAFAADRPGEAVPRPATAAPAPGAEFRAWRERLGLSVQAAAELLECSAGDISAWERSTDALPGPVRVACRLLEAARR